MLHRRHRRLLPLACDKRASPDLQVRHVMMRQGMLGVKVKIMLPQDPEGKLGPKNPLSDIVTILEPKDEPDVAPAY